MILDINPQLEVFRCFGMSDGYHDKLKMKKTIEGVVEGMKGAFERVEKNFF